MKRRDFVFNVGAIGLLYPVINSIPKKDPLEFREDIAGYNVYFNDELIGRIYRNNLHHIVTSPKTSICYDCKYWIYSRHIINHQLSGPGRDVLMHDGLYTTTDGAGKYTIQDCKNWFKFKLNLFN